MPSTRFISAAPQPWRAFDSSETDMETGSWPYWRKIDHFLCYIARLLPEALNGFCFAIYNSLFFEKAPSAERVKKPSNFEYLRYWFLLAISILSFFDIISPSNWFLHRSFSKFFFSTNETNCRPHLRGMRVGGFLRHLYAYLSKYELQWRLISVSKNNFELCVLSSSLSSLTDFVGWSLR